MPTICYRAYLSMMTTLFRQVQSRMMGASLTISSGLHMMHLTCTESTLHRALLNQALSVTSTAELCSYNSLSCKIKNRSLIPRQHNTTRSIVQGTKGTFPL